MGRGPLGNQPLTTLLFLADQDGHRRILLSVDQAGTPSIKAAGCTRQRYVARAKRSEEVGTENLELEDASGSRLDLSIKAHRTSRRNAPSAAPV
jgi:hypothetical protein